MKSTLDASEPSDPGEQPFSYPGGRRLNTDTLRARPFAQRLGSEGRNHHSSRGRDSWLLSERYTESMFCVDILITSTVK